MPLITFEGVDKAGKSTVSKYLAAMLGGKWLHYSKPDKHPSKYFKPALDLAKKGKLVVCDRHCLGEKVYAHVKGEDSQWSITEYEAMLKEMEKMHAIIVIVHEKVAFLKKRFVEEKETYITWQQGVVVQKLFLKEAKRIAEKFPGILVFTYQPTTDTIRKLGART